jgi:hypothetical protein
LGKSSSSKKEYFRSPAFHVCVGEGCAKKTLKFFLRFSTSLEKNKTVFGSSVEGSRKKVFLCEKLKEKKT